MNRSSYKYEDFMKFQSINNVLPQQLVQYCISDSYHKNQPDISSFDNQLTEIITSITKGDNPNDIIFRNLVKFCINMMNQANYQEYLQKLKSLDFSTKENIHFLASELIVCTIRCPISVKGFTFQEDPKYKSVPEICADICKQFSPFIVKSKENKDISFHEELMKICQQYFTEFVDLNKSLDENNENTADNYKGFMTLMGLLYSRGICNIKVIIDCMDTLKRTIFCTVCTCPNHLQNIASHSCNNYHKKIMGLRKKEGEPFDKMLCYYDCDKCEKNELITYRKHVECSNIHKGYEHLVNHIVHSLELKINDILKNYEDKTSQYEKDESNEDLLTQINTLKTTIEKICEYIDSMIKIHQEFMECNKKYRSLNKNQLIMPFKPFTIITHNTIGTNLNKLHEKLFVHCNKFPTVYKVVPVTKS